MDALPYIDTITREEQEQVDRLIAEEKEKSEKKPKDYLNGMSPIGQPSFGGSEALQTEYKRVKNGKAMESLDTQRYALPEPPLDWQNDPDAWGWTLRNAQAQLENQRLRTLNLELELKFAPAVWKKANEQSQRVDDEYRNALSSSKEQIAEINKKRKLSQMEVGKKLAKLDREWHHLIRKNFEILQVCEAKRRAIEELRSRLQKGETQESQ